MTRNSRNNGGSQPKKNGAKDFIAVGIGASAGGIKALKEFFASTPADPGMAFVVILHLSPTHESSLPQILQNETTLPVTQVTETVKVEPNHVYVIPPNKNLAMVDGVIELTEPEPTRGTRVAIDLFFRTLARAYGANAVCIVLSGTGSDGTLGLKQVKESNGFAIVQDPKEAEYDTMPQSAIATNLADWILPVAEMPGKLITFRDSSERLNLTNGNKKAPVEIKDIEDLSSILTMIRVQTGHDFSSYKHPTLLRRIARHLQIHELEDISAYLDLLRENAEEMQSLVKNLLINVTNFFRDKDAFEALEKKVVPKLFENKTGKDQVRVWSVGCASGEEAYSLAILLNEYSEGLTDPPKIQIFATDVDDEAIAEARENGYPETIEADVSTERLRRFFTKDGNRYKVRKDVRETILFAPHNILSNPPFSRLDLITCRNLLIYLNRDTQNRVIQIFHFALNQSGLLFLGNSESAESQLAFFAPLDKKNRIFKRRPSSAAPKPSAVLPLTGDWKLRLPDARAGGTNERLLSFGEMHYKLVEQYAPPSVLVNEDFEIVHLSESAGKYLRFAGGEPSKNILKAVHPDLLGDLRAALFSVRQDGVPAEFRNIRTGTDNGEIFTGLIVRPVEIAEAGGRFLLVIFNEEKNSVPTETSVKTVTPVANEDAIEAIVTRLEEDLQRTKARLRTTIEQHETSIEELKASNEELQAVNEEMRSASEELETGKEELQSVNEELTTVNQELKEKVEETNRTNSDLQNLMASTDIGTIFLDRELRLKLYTRSVEKLFNIIPGDLSRPLDHITHNLDYNQMTADAAEVLKTLKPSEREICDNKGHCYLVRILPYRTTGDRIEGVVITFVDITTRIEAEKRLRWLATVVESSNDAIFSFAFDQKIVSWNAGAEKIFGYVAEETIGHQLSMLTKPGGTEEQDELLDRTWRGETVENFETAQVNKAGALVDISLTLSPLRDENQHVVGMTATVRDITKRLKSDRNLRESEERQRLLIDSATDFAIFTLSPDGKVDTWNTGAERVFGFTESEILGQPGEILFTPEDRANGVPQQEMRTAAKKGRAEDERYHIRKDGSRFYASGVMTSLLSAGGRQGYAKIARDLTERKKMEEALKRAQEDLETKVIERTAELAETNESLRREIVERKRAEEERVGLLRKIVTTQEDERSRIARDMHDQLGQRLTALRLKIASLKEICADNEDLCARVERLGEIGAGLDAEVSFLAWELRPAVLDDLGLVVAADNYVTEWSKHFEIPAEFQSTGLKKTRLDPETETNLYRITQEALNNTFKHAKASRASVLLEKRHKSVVLIIEDDGIGFDPNKKRRITKSGRGLGLIGIRERAAIVGGSVEIESTPGKGTTIYVRVPFPPVVGGRFNGN
jgi:two-component system CheB/CheR fusion protein